jgi:EmrB/QacA subfamily drug resistance transporter
VRRDLGGSTATLQWLTAAYLLPFAVLLITGGRLGDIFGRRRIFLIGATGFTLASLACATAQTSGMLLGFRAAQGAFGALLIPQGFGVIKEVWPQEQIQKAFAMFGPVMGLSAVCGPILAGSLIDANLGGSSWRAIFLLNLPLGIAAVIGATRLFPSNRVVHEGKVDLVGIVAVGAAMLAIVYPLVEGRERGWPAWMFVLIAGGLVLLGVFARRTLHSTDGRPTLVEPSLLRNGVFISGLAVATSYFAAMSGLMLTFSLFAQLGLHYSPLHAGLSMAPLPLGIAITAPTSFALVNKLGRVVAQLGLGLLAAGMVLLAAMVAHSGAGTSTWTLVPGTFLSGLGMGYVLAPLFNFVLAGVEDHEVGSASGVLNAIQQTASALGIAVVGTILFAFLDDGSSSWDAFAWTLVCTLGLLAISALLVFRLPRMPRPEAA